MKVNTSEVNNYHEKLIHSFDLCLTLRAIFWKCQRYHCIRRMMIQWKPTNQPISLSGLFELEHHVLPWYILPTYCWHFSGFILFPENIQLNISALLLGKTLLAGGFRTLSELVGWLVKSSTLAQVVLKTAGLFRNWRSGQRVIPRTGSLRAQARKTHARALFLARDKHRRAFWENNLKAIWQPHLPS